MAQIDFLVKAQQMLLWVYLTGKGNARTIRDTIAIYMPQTLKFNMAAEYGDPQDRWCIRVISKDKRRL